MRYRLCSWSCIKDFLHEALSRCGIEYRLKFGLRTENYIRIYPGEGGDLFALYRGSVAYFG